jgi:hypothetical protein
MKPLQIISLILIIASCSSNSKPKYFWVSYTGDRADTTLIKRIEVDSFPSGAKTYFYYTGDTTHYFLRPDTLQGSQINLYWKTNQSLRLFHDTTIILNADTFHVFEFIQNEAVMDGATIHYWETKFGIYAKHSVTWPGLTILQTDDSVQNKKLKFLIRQTVPKFFLRKEVLSDITK